MVDGKLVSINGSSLTEPATKLIDAVRAGIALIYEPTAIRRQAAAQADALRTLADAAVDVELRAKARLNHIESRRQDNIEKIVEVAEQCLPAQVSQTPVEDDWLHFFFESCKDIGASEVQALWGRILAGEIGRPGTFSRRSISILRLLSTADAKLFEAVVSRSASDGTDTFLIYTDDSMEYLGLRGIGSHQLGHLVDLGLLHSYGTQTFSFKREAEMAFTYGNVKYVIAAPDVFKMLGGPMVPFAPCLFSQVGQELASLCGPERDQEYWDLLARHFVANLFCVKMVQPPA